MSKRKADDSSHHEQSAKRQRKIFDGTFYMLKDDAVDNDDNSNTDLIVAQCMICTKETFIRGNNSSTGNFYKHFRKLHNDKVDELKNHCDSKTKPASRGVKKNENVQSILPFVNTLDSIKVGAIHEVVDSHFIIEFMLYIYLNFFVVFPFIFNLTDA